ncbi:MAG TPA: glycosyltransferase family 39 protein [Patescibacteria group bacterium]|nr:glycosyltransferase family 39 protein [Patescibacteria group bacterium]
MNIIIRKWKYFLLALVLVMGFWLRSNNLYTWPRLGATFDEYAWTWLGISILQNHIPTSWSPHPEYTKAKDIIYQKTHFRLVTPYLEHPPLFGLIAGEYALLSGVKDMFHVDLQHIRGLAVLLGVFSVFMVFLFTKELYGENVGLLASFLYAIIPSIAIGSRLVENENFFIPFFLLALFFTSRYLRTKRNVFYIVTIIICGLLTLAKVPWATATIAIFLILLSQKMYKRAFLFVLGVLPIFGLFFVWGLYWDSHLFFSLWSLQLNRYDIAFNSVYALFTYPVLTDREFLDGWIYFGWFAIFLLVAKDFKKHIFIVLPFLAYFLVYVYAIPNELGHGWYRYPFYPFFVIAIALFVKEYFNKNYLLTFFFLLLTGLSMLGQSWTQAFGFSFMVFRFFLGLYGITLLPLFFPKTQKLSHAISYISLLSIFLLTIWSVFGYNEQ